NLYEVRFDDASRAAAARERAAYLDPSRSDAVLPLLEQLGAENRFGEQADLLDRHLASSAAAARQPDLHLILAELYMDALREPARARQHLEAALAIDPANERALDLLEPLLEAEPEALGRLLEQRADQT